MFVAIISLTSIILLNYCELKIEIISPNLVQVRNTLKVIELYTNKKCMFLTLQSNKKTSKFPRESVTHF